MSNQQFLFPILLSGEELLFGQDDVIDFFAQYGQVRVWSDGHYVSLDRWEDGQNLACASVLGRRWGICVYHPDEDGPLPRDDFVVALSFLAQRGYFRCPEK